MPTSPLLDLATFDLTAEAFDKAAIRCHNPHRFEFELVDSIVHFDDDTLEAVGYHDLAEDAFWIRGHIPGTPIFPGALMVEAGAQLSAFCFRRRMGSDDTRFFGFGGIDKVKFRGMAKPGDRMWLICVPVSVSRRRSVFKVQGVVNDKIVFDGEITGVSMPVQTQLDASPN